MTFGERLKKARKEKRLTQRELATLIGAKNNSVSNWEKDQNRPNGSTILMLTQVLDISPLYLIGEYTLNDVCMLEDKDPALLTDDDKMAIDFFKAQSVDFGNNLQAAFRKNALTDDTVALLEAYSMLNDKGKQRLKDNLQDLLMLPIYTENAVNAISTGIENTVDGVAVGIDKVSTKIADILTKLSSKREKEGGE